MEWLWAGIGAFWTSFAAIFGLYLWRAPDRWRCAGRLNNGLGTTIIIDENRRGVRFLLLATRFLSFFVFLMAFGGLMITVGWLWKAL